jgi:hypothetical protein
MRRITTQLDLLAFLLVMSIGSAHGQRYKTAVGLRLSGEYGINVSQKIADRTTLQINHEGGFLSGDKTSSVHYIGHSGIFQGGLNVFAGAGINGYYRAANEDLPVRRGLRPSAILGTEATIGRLNMAFDWTPTFNLAKNADKFNSTFGFTIRYVFVKN